MADEIKAPDSIEAIQGLWDLADSSTRERYLLNAFNILQKNICREIQILHQEIKSMKISCECRIKDCKGEFVTRKQARLFGIIFLLCVGCFLVGGGIITWNELISIANGVAP